jgi:hypothetical protein
MSQKKCRDEADSEILRLQDWQRRSSVERRTKIDQQGEGSSDLLAEWDRKKRKFEERRKSGERREGWMRIDKWRSIPVFDE